MSSSQPPKRKNPKRAVNLSNSQPLPNVRQKEAKNSVETSLISENNDRNDGNDGEGSPIGPQPCVFSDV